MLYTLSSYVGIFIPFLGTVFGAACVFFIKNEMSVTMRRSLAGFAAGVMVAASVWSLLIPAMESSEALGRLSFLPAVTGFWLGILFLFLLDNIIPHMHVNLKTEGPKSKLKKSTMLLLAVTLHNIPEGMALGIVYAGYITESVSISQSGVLALAVGLAIQNIPEGAIVSMPLRAQNISRKRAFLYGTLSGVVEPIGAVVMICLSSFLLPAIPYLLSFAAGSMIYVVVEELIPESVDGDKHSNIGTICFALGFSLMMILDVALG